MDISIFCLIFLVIPINTICIIILLHSIHRKKVEINKKIEKLSSGVEEYTPEEFFKLRNYSFGVRDKQKYALTMNFTGVYIIFNKTKNMYYVGQAHKILV